MPIPPNEDHLHLRHWNGFFRFTGNTPIVIVNTANTIVWRWENSHAFGANLPEEDPDDNAQLFEYHPGFPGQYFDKETNLHYNYFRCYEPETGCYISHDPVGFAVGLNIYGYLASNPTGFADPKGEAIPAIIVTCAGNPARAAATIDLASQLFSNGNNLKCIDKGSIALSAGVGALPIGLLVIDFLKIKLYKALRKRNGF